MKLEMGKLGPKLQVPFLNSIQICRPKDTSSLVINPSPLLSHDILFPSFQAPSPASPPFMHATPSSKSRKLQEAKVKAEEEKEKEEEEEESKTRRRGVRTRRFKRFGSKEWSSSSEVDRKVNESFVVMKRSVDPCQDFKKSMLEMIVEKHLFEPKELEHLLMSFLSLNSTAHHRAILKAFTEIWKEVFSPGSST